MGGRGRASASACACILVLIADFFMVLPISLLTIARAVERYLAFATAFQRLCEGGFRLLAGGADRRF